MLSPDSIPIFIVVLHLINLICLILLIRSGIQILADHPKLYWTDDTKAENYWLKFGKKKMPKDRLWTSLDEAENVGKYALPSGTHNLGAARHWHFTTAIVWVITGSLYYIFMFTTGAWRRIIPTNIDVFSRALHTLETYMTLNIPPASAFQPYDALQQLAYGGVVFILAPLMILTGLAMSPALVARFPWYLNLFCGKRQIARSLHFIGMIGFCLFILIHITMSSLVYFSSNIKKITFGNDTVSLRLAVSTFITVIILIILFNIWITFFTLNNQVKVRKILTAFYVPVVRFFFGRLYSRQRYTKKDISPFFRVNGYPPKTEVYKKLKANNFADWRLKVYGLVDQPLELSLEQLHNLPKHEQITKHNCIQGWSAVAEWGGVRMSEIIKMCKPQKNAKYVIFNCFDEDDTKAGFYEGLRMSDMKNKQTILAYEMNYDVLPEEHGAPLRLRCESKYGYKMAKYIKSIEFVESFEHVGQGRGGYREDTVFFDWEAAI